jgi:DNA mismatch repair protein MutS
MQRRVRRIITPGTVSDEALLDATQDNILVAVSCHKDQFGIAILDMASGRFEGIHCIHSENLASELTRLKPAELLLPDNWKEDVSLKQFPCIRRHPEWDFHLDVARRLLIEQLQVKDLHALGYERFPLIMQAAGALLKYAYLTQQTTLMHIKRLRILQAEKAVFLDAATQRHLELVENFQGGKDKTLIWILDKTVTAMGSRLLRRWLTRPIRDIAILKGRQQAIQRLMTQEPNIHQHAKPVFSKLQEMLKVIGDLERILARIGLKSARPRDLVQLRNALKIFPQIKLILAQIKHEIPLFSHIYEKIYLCDDLLQQLETAFVDDPPLLIREGRFFAKGYHLELDTLRSISENADEFLEGLANREKAKNPELDTLKVGFNRIHGYYLEVSRRQASSLLQNKDYERRQTLKNVERFITPELKRFEIRALSARAKALALEKQLYETLLDHISITYLKELQKTAEACSTLDVLGCLAERAIKLNLICPIFSDEPGIYIEEGRHLVIEALADNPFVANSIDLNNTKRTLIITGPNMGGKSTYMRQTALITLLTMIGSFVPAKKAIIYPVDGIFTRIGASDDLASGRSTFMVEMSETAYILHHATKNSLVLIDEIGRGTSTFDGLALAFACAEYLSQQINAYTLFATHYFELTSLDHFDNISNIHFAVATQGSHLAFLYTVSEGPASQSYGIHVAQLAGIPLPVVQRAKEKLLELEQ